MRMNKTIWSLMLAALVLAPAAYGQREPEWGKPLDPDDPLGDLGLRMESITKDLASLKTDKLVQQKQQDVISQLDKLIEELQKQSGQ